MLTETKAVLLLCVEKKYISLRSEAEQSKLEQAVQWQRGQSVSSMLKLPMSLTAAKDRLSPYSFNPLNAELNPICRLLALLGANHFLHVSRIRVKSLTLRLLMSYTHIYMEHPFLMFLDHTQRRTTVGRTPLDE